MINYQGKSGLGYFLGYAKTLVSENAVKPADYSLGQVPTLASTVVENVRLTAFMAVSERIHAYR